MEILKIVLKYSNRVNGCTFLVTVSVFIYSDHRNTLPVPLSALLFCLCPSFFVNLFKTILYMQSYLFLLSYLSVNVCCLLLAGFKRKKEISNLTFKWFNTNLIRDTTKNHLNLYLPGMT